MIDEKSLKYAATHEWVQVNGDTATIGLSRFAVDQLTDLIVIDLPEVGRTLEAGKSFGEIESVKAVSDLYAPVGGEVVEVNPAVADDVQVLAEDPYTKGWLIKVKMAPGADLSGLLDYNAYQKKVAESGH
jgi:glycine cleavage system H protein